MTNDTTTNTAKFTHEVALPDGQTITKQSKRTFTHAVCVIVDADVESAALREEMEFFIESDPVKHAARIERLAAQIAAPRQWKVLHWCGSLALADKQATYTRTAPLYADVRIVEAVEMGGSEESPTDGDLSHEAR